VFGLCTKNVSTDCGHFAHKQWPYRIKIISFHFTEKFMKIYSNSEKKFFMSDLLNCIRTFFWVLLWKWWSRSIVVCFWVIYVNFVCSAKNIFLVIGNSLSFHFYLMFICPSAHNTTTIKGQARNLSLIVFSFKHRESLFECSFLPSYDFFCGHHKFVSLF
jgi:hypothetical protein